MDEKMTPQEKLEKFLQDNNFQIQVRPTFRLMKNGFYAVQNIINVVERPQEIVEPPEEAGKEEEQV